MKKKGFTLVEMLAVVVIMGLLIIVAIPQIQNLVASKRGTIKETTLQMIYDAADSYTSSDTDTFQKMYISSEENASYCITIQDLVNAGKIDEENLKEYIDYDAKNEEKQVNFLDRIISIKTNAYNEFEYELLSTNQCSSNALNNGEAKPLYKEDGIEVPNLQEGMIPVEYNDSIHSWVIADVTKEWYNYSNKKWANMVTVSLKASDCESRGNCIDSNFKHSRSGYKRAVPGTRISLDDVTGMYVWIPGSSVWIGKFEVSAPINTSCFQTPDISSCNKDFIDLVVVPKRNSWKGISIQNAKKVVQNMATSNNFGLDSSKVESHLMKKTEWDAVKSLTNSSYGRGNNSIYVNNYGVVDLENKTTDTTLTGCSSGNTSSGASTSCKYTYEANEAVQGTTTGNITGIYDLAGGASEFVDNNGSSLICGGDYTSGTNSGLNICSSSNGEANEKIGFRPVIKIK